MISHFWIIMQRLEFSMFIADLTSDILRCAPAVAHTSVDNSTCNMPALQRLMDNLLFVTTFSCHDNGLYGQV